MLKDDTSVALLAGVVGLPMGAVAPAAMAAHVGEAFSYGATADKCVGTALTTFVSGLRELKDELNAANKEQAGWGAYGADWFQGDEEKFTMVENQRTNFSAPSKRDATVGKTGIQASIPVWDTADGKETFIGVAVALVIGEDVK